MMKKLEKVLFILCILTTTVLVGCQSKKKRDLDLELTKAAMGIELSQEESFEKFKKLINTEPEKIGENPVFDLVAFFEACVRGNPEKVRRFIDAGIDVNAKSPLLGKTVLHYACERGNIEIVKLLIDAGANIEGRADSTKYGPVQFPLRPLTVACNWNHEDIALLLISRGASLEPTDEDNSPLDCAHRNGLTRVVDAILRKTKTRR